MPVETNKEKTSSVGVGATQQPPGVNVPEDVSYR